jgi:50S ribosomal subunit-associated GTPase HflX
MASLMYIVSLSSFDQLCEEDGTTNQIEESVAVFKSLMGIERLSQVPLILFFNKKDLLEKKLRSGRKLGDHFKEYKGTVKTNQVGGDAMTAEIEQSINFIKNRFYSYIPESRLRFKFVTQATNQKVMQTVLRAVYNVIITNCLKSNGII